jgi:hypothetical protein
MLTHWFVRPRFHSNPPPLKSLGVFVQKKVRRHQGGPITPSLVVCAFLTHSRIRRDPLSLSEFIRDPMVHLGLPGLPVCP